MNVAAPPPQARPAGLDSDEARRRLARDGPNALPGSRHQPLLRIVLKVLLEPMFLLLLTAGGLYLALGDRAEAAFLLGSVLLVIGITLAQERKTQRALEALRDLSAPRALVVRDGRHQRIPASEVVRGDLLVLGEGDRIAADGLLREGLLEVDESLLTGEAVAATRLPGGESARVSAGTVVTKGRGLAEVVATGSATAMGRIGLALASTRETPSGMQRASARLVRALAIAAVSLAVAYTLLRWLWDGATLLDGILAGVALSMAILPEEIPVILTVFLAMGAWRMARHQVLTRRMAAVEALGAVTVLAVDKTGTLTQNRMRLMEMARPDGGQHLNGTGLVLPPGFAAVVHCLLLATPPSPFDPMEQAIYAFAARYTDDRGSAAAPAAVHEYPLSPEVLAMTRAFPAQHPGQYALAAKGAPEAIVALCRLSPPDTALALAQVEAMAARGLRVLGVAEADWHGPEWPGSQRDFHYRLLGFVGFGDPPRDGVPAAVAECRQAGVRVLMLTGDHPVTARAIGDQIGMAPGREVLTGDRIDALDDDALRERLRRVDICARLRPEQKLRLVRLLQQSGEVVAMTGDGVNDAPALKAADVGIAMGERGTDVAREAAALVLLDDSFASIVRAIRQGRRIYDNIVNATAYVFAVHAPVIGLALMPALLHWPLLLMPTHIVLLELVIDPACSLVFEAEPEAPDVMRRPPRSPGESPFAPAKLAYALVQGGGLAIILLCGCGIVLWQGWSASETRTVMFLGLVACLLLLVLVRRQRHVAAAAPGQGNRWLLLMPAGLGGILVVALGVPVVRGLLDLAPPNPGTAAAAVVMVLALVSWLALLPTAAHGLSQALSSRRSSPRGSRDHARS
ncbi:cation-translocating P-type ATPase [Frateuria terrea]|uniref:Ca2+-transporting ATPase n=1 Tax=Frateuria terrea TaxID=529704 RepID=A0A1H6URC6_9GAMM|nr:cation-translocating P-type ATPase [Frateuria terrea]SEI94831.1 Ca2+-transporting ATPase [Frateuria terrea]SFP33757.1 Ca2+-transporting ATPase [Frateuria terrea]